MTLRSCSLIMKKVSCRISTRRWGRALTDLLMASDLAHCVGCEPEQDSRKNVELIPVLLQIGGSLAKVVYFTRAPRGSSASPAPSKARSTSPPSTSSTNGLPDPTTPLRKPRTPSPPSSPAQPNGILGPKSLSQRPHTSTSGAFQSHLRRRSSTSRIPSGGRLNFIKFETSKLNACISFLETLISSSAASNRVPLDVMKRSVKIMATGGGAHKFHERLRNELGVEVVREEEMECLVLGLGFVMEVPNEVFWYSDELVQAISHPHGNAPLKPFPSLDPDADPFPRPSPNPPQYSLSFDSNPTPAQFPCLLVNIGSGVSIIKIDDYGKYERISGTSLGGGTLWGLLSLLTGAKSFDGESELICSPRRAQELRPSPLCLPSAPLLPSFLRHALPRRQGRQLLGRHARRRHLRPRVREDWTQVEHHRLFVRQGLPQGRGWDHERGGGGGAEEGVQARGYLEELAVCYQ